MIPRINLTPKTQIKTVSQKFLGLNRNAEINSGEFSSTTNLNTDNIPFMSPRQSRETIRTIAMPRGMGATEDKLYWVSGTDFYYDNVKKNGTTALAASTKNMFQFGNKIIIFPDLMYYDFVLDVFGIMNPSYTSGASQITYKNVSQSVLDGSTVTFATDRITISGTTWDTGMTVGNTIKIYGNVAYPENEGYFTILEVVSTTVLRFAAASFTAGTEAASTMLTFSFSSITTTGTAFSGFSVDDWVKISGNTTKKLNNKTIEIKGVSASVLSFEYDDLYSSAAVAEAITIKIPVPAMDYGCSHNNRIWGVKNDTIYVSGLGRYNLFEPFTIDYNTLDFAYAGETDLKGSFIGIMEYGTYIVAIKRDQIFEIYNENPPYRIKTIIKEGGISNKSMVEFNGRLYFLNDKKGIVSYAGGYPQSESQALNETYTSAVCGTDNKKVYCSLYNGSAYKLYVMDQSGTWIQEDTLNVIDFVKMGGYLYALDSSGNMLKFNSGSESISSEGILNVETYGSYSKKYIARVYIRLEVTTGAVAVLLKQDNGSFTSLKTIAATALTTYEIKMLPKRIDHVQLKITGTGSYKIHEIGTGVIPGGGV